jgi:hypothetical protein
MTGTSLPRSRILRCAAWCWWGSHDAASRLRPKLIEQDLEPVGMAAAEFRTWLERDIAKWREVVRAANIRPD